MKKFKQLKEDLGFVKKFDEIDAHAAANMLGLQFVPLKDILKNKSRQANEVDLVEFLSGINIELEHSGSTNGDLVSTAKIVLDHLQEIPDYYKRLQKMEKSAKK